MKRVIAWTMACVIGFAASAIGAELDVPLTLTERAGQARFNEPVTGGVPLPEGLIKDVGELALIGPDGKRVPAQFAAATRWYPGKSIKWVLLDFQASVPANGKVRYTLANVGQNPAPKSAVAVAKIDGNAVTITNGRLKLIIRRDKFNLIDEAWLDGVQIVKPHNGGPLLMQGGNGMPDFKRYSPLNDPTCTLEVEESGPMRAVVKVTGKHISKDHMPGDKRLLDFVCRIHVHAGSGLVKVVYSMMNRQGKSIGQGVPLDRAWFSLPLALDMKTRTWAVGLPNGKAIHPGTDVAKEMTPWRKDLVGRPGPQVKKYHQAGLADCWIHADRSDRITYHGDFFRKREPVVAKGKLDKKGSLTAGWLDLADADKGCATGIKWFWQTWPRAVKVDPSALIVMLHANFASRPPLMTRANCPRATWYPGMSQTSTTMFYFHGKRDIPKIVGAYAGLNKPLRPIAPASWYSEKTQVLGRLASGNPKLYDAATAKQVADYDKRLKATLNHILKLRDFGYGDYDHYGMFNFGDVIDYIRGNRSNPTDRNVTWDNNYYDYAHALFLQFARTGDEDFLDTAIEAQHHLMDMDMMCWHTNDKMIGCNRYCDGGMHIRMGGGGIYASATFNHYKTQSHFERFYLTGERRARDMGLLSARFAMKNAGLGWGEPRSMGHGPLGPLAAWEATGDVKYLQRMRTFEHKKYADTHRARKPARVSKGRHWQGGIAFEASREYYEHTGDPKGLETLKVLAAHCYSIRDWSPSTLHAFAFLGAQLDNKGYSARARKQVWTAGSGITKRSWGFAQSFGNQLRNTPYVFWYLTKDLPKKLEPKKMEF
jgi:exo-rhamnogalacturonan lyase-like protein